MDKKYNHIIVEKGKNDKWIEKQYFSTHDVSKKPFTIILPPPNVTGKLHIGHSWDGFLQDAMIRFKKLRNFDVMWVPAMDHAGIATQAKVEQRLNADNILRQDIGREKFIQKIWDWKNEYASNIKEQWSKLGLALDYPNERFTLDEGLSNAVTKVFIDLYKRKIIYRANRAVNWDPKLKTVLSNIEVISKDVEQTMFYIEYDVKDTDEKVVIATTRPETLFSDVALAVNPQDETKKHLLNKIIIHPITKKEIPVITSELIELDKGTGIMKVSAHAENDIEIIKSNDLEIIECIDQDGKMKDITESFSGMDRFEARKKVIDLLRSDNRIVKEEKTISAVGFSERSDAIVEILAMPQWFVKMDDMSKNVLSSLNNDEVKFFPPRFKNTLKQWMEKSYDWCISRQIWWGHRIPAWYKGDEIKVQELSPGTDWKQDEDVLDTWFSSGLAPFSFLGWPNDDKKLERYYPTSLLVTGYDIIFYWVARMYFQSLDIMKNKPFDDVLIHGLVRDEKGRKMSKSLNNGIDPMQVIDEYGSDALRWFFLTNSSPGQDISFSYEKLKAAWNLNNKIWNISRYIIESMPKTDIELSSADIWINNQLVKLESLIESKIKDYEFAIIGKEIQKFIVDDFSSWYIEMSKTNPNQKFAISILKHLLKLIHPFLPFITDHLYEIMGEEILSSDIVSLKTIKETNDISQAINITKLLRMFRHDRNISHKEKIFFHTSWPLETFEVDMVKKLANAHPEKNEDFLIPFNDQKIYVKISEDQKNEMSLKNENHIKHLENEISRAKGILSNQGFLSKAPQEKIDVEKKKLEKFENELALLINEK